MKIVQAFTLSLAVLIAMTSPGAAHTLEELQEQLRDRETYFQPMDQDAPEFTLKDADGREISLESLKGKVVVLHFIYTNCPDVCPLHAQRIAEIQEMINGTPMREQVQFVTITTDPENDTSTVMRDYGKAHGLDPQNWVFLTSGQDKPEATRTLAERYGHKFTKTDDGYQMHGVVTHVISQKGRWTANFHGLSFKPVNLVAFVNAQINVDVPHGHAAPSGDDHRSFWDKLREWF